MTANNNKIMIIAKTGKIKTKPFDWTFNLIWLKLFTLLNVCGILIQNEGPIKDKAFWPVFVFRKGLFSFKTSKLILLNITNRGNFENFIQVVWTTAIDKFKHDSNNALFKSSTKW